MMQCGFDQIGVGLPLAPNPEQAGRLYDWIEYKNF